MPTASVLLCPPLPGCASAFDETEAAAQVSLAGASPVLVPGVGGPPPAVPRMSDPQVRRWLADCVLRLRVANPPGPTLVVLQGAATALAADVGFALSAARRARSGYVLVGGELPRAGLAEWPDAPVILLNADGEAARVALLRGWETIVGHPPAVLRGIASRP